MLAVIKKRAIFVLMMVMMVGVFPLMKNTKAYAMTTVDNAMAWVQGNVGRAIDYDGAYGAQCVDLIAAYYAHLGVRTPGGNGCDYARNALPAGWSRVQGGAPQRGDILVYNGSSSNPYGHVAIYESDYVTYHQNFNGIQRVQKVTSVRYNGLTNSYWGYIRPNWTNDTTPPSFSGSKYIESNRGYYVVQAYVTDNVGVTKVEFPAWTPGDGQNDLVWHQGTKINDNTWQCTINVSDHNMEAGNYITHIYAYDAAGNKSSIDAGVITINDYSKNSLVNFGDDFYAYINTGAGTRLAVSDTKTAINNTYYDLIHAKYDASKDNRFLWHFIRDASTGTYMIKNDATSTLLDVAYFSLDNKANIILTGVSSGVTKGTTNQQWKISKNNSGYQFSTVCTKYTAMDIQGSNSGTSVYMYYYSPVNTNQIFNIERKIDDREVPVITQNSLAAGSENTLSYKALITDNYGLNMLKNEHSYLYFSTDESSGRIVTVRGIKNTNWNEYSLSALYRSSINKKSYNLEAVYDVFTDGVPAIEITVTDLAGNETTVTTRCSEAIMVNSDRVRYEIEPGESIALSSIFEAVMNRNLSSNYIIHFDSDNMRILKKTNIDSSSDLRTDADSVNELTTVFTGNEPGVEHIYFVNIKTGSITSCRIKVNGKEEETPVQSENPSVIYNPITTQAPVIMQSPAQTVMPIQTAKPVLTYNSYTPVSNDYDRYILKDMNIKSFDYKYKKRQIVGKLSVSNAKVKIKVGKKAWKTAKVNGKKFTLKVGKLKKVTKIKVKVTKQGYNSINTYYWCY